jgi:hypothetical protein
MEDVNSKSPEVQIKTAVQPGQADKPTVVFDSGGTNVLNQYRLFTYVFTLSGLNKDDVKDPSKFEQNQQSLLILKSGGKGSAGIYPNSAVYSNTSDQLKDIESNKKTNKVTKEAQTNDVLNQVQNTENVIGGFNARSPGRFDMFLDDVEIDTIMGFTQEGGTTQPTKIKFKVFEPYSINGFVEALHVAANASGYPTYQSTPFLLKMEFIGYPDDADLAAPERVQDATRYFPITITKLEVVLNETGTLYSVEAIPFNEAGFGNPSQLKKSVKMSGGTVKEILNNLMDGMNKQVKEADEAAKKPSKLHDQYRVIFPDWVEGKGWDKNKENKIAGAKITELLKDNTLYKFPDPGGSTKSKPTPEQNARQPESFKYEPSSGAVQFPEGKGLNECIQSIIRDSRYIRNIVEKLPSPEFATVIDNNGMIDYFLVKLEIENNGEVDPDLKRPHQIFTFVVTPHKISYTRIPGYGNQQVDMKQVSKLSLRQYNYIYTGKNVDILNFKLDFNNLFFEAVPLALGADKSAPSRDSAGRNNSTDPQSKPDDLEKDRISRLPATPKYVDPRLTGTGAQDNAVRQDSAYYALAKGMHDALVNAKASMITGEMDILGDPLYLVTGGIGGQNPAPKPTSNRVTNDGEANFNMGEVLITINFRNPIDIAPLEQGGRLQFDSELIPFSGIYRVNRVRTKFKDGVFKQTLEIIRFQGQPFPTENPSNAGINSPTLPTGKMVTAKRSNDQISQDTTPAQEVINTDTGVSGDRASTFNLMSQLNRGLPSPGLPGELSNFTAATGGLGGTVALNQVSGATPNLAGASRLAGQAFGGSIPGRSLFAGGIPMNAQAAINLRQQVLRPAGLVQQIGANLLNTFGITGGAAQLANQFITQASRQIRLPTALGSGIGVGTTFNYTPGIANPLSTYDIRSNPIATLPSVPYPVTGSATSMDANSLSAAQNVTNPGVTSIDVSGIQQKAKLDAIAKAKANGLSDIDAENAGSAAGNLAGADALANLNLSSASRSNAGISPSTSGVAGQSGIDASQLSGLSPNLTSKLGSQVNEISQSIPADTNLSQVIAQGITINNMDKESLKHLPPTQPYNTAPNAQVDDLYLGHLAATGGQSAVARSFGVSSLSQVSQNQLPSQDAQAILGQGPQYAPPTSLTALPPNIIDSVANATKYLTNNNALGNISGLLGTREGQLLQLQNRFPGSQMNVVTDLGSSVASQFGSKSSGQSPLDKLMIR